SRFADLKKTPPIPRMRPRCPVLTGAFDFSGCRDCASCPPLEQTEMSNSEASAIVLQGISRICGLYRLDSNGEKRLLKVRAAIRARRFESPAPPGKRLGHTLHHERDILRGFGDKGVETRMRGFKCKPTFVSGFFESWEALILPFEGHHLLRHRTLRMLVQQV